MSDLRYDPVSGIWVAIARKRRERPMEFVPVERIHQQIVCPFCRGNEDETPQPVVAYGPDGSELSSSDDPSGWAVRIMPNKYPSLIGQSVGGGDCGPYACSNANGIQELVIPTPRHVTSIGELTVGELSFGLQCCQDRIAHLRGLDSIEHVMLFFNCRSAAGASIEHIHFQLMGTPVLSSFLMQRLQRNDKRIQETGDSLLASILSWELKQSKRILSETENFVMFCPYASRFAFQVWIVPRTQELSFSRAETDFNCELAELCHAYVSKLEDLIERPAYNMMLNLAPNRFRDSEHWFIELVPRLHRMAGFELGTDVWVNPVPPELAAKRLAF